MSTAAMGGLYEEEIGRVRGGVYNNYNNIK